MRNVIPLHFLDDFMGKNDPETRFSTTNLDNVFSHKGTMTKRHKNVKNFPAAAEKRKIRDSGRKREAPKINHRDRSA